MTREEAAAWAARIRLGEPVRWWYERGTNYLLVGGKAVVECPEPLYKAPEPTPWRLAASPPTVRMDIEAAQFNVAQLLEFLDKP